MYKTYGFQDEEYMTIRGDILQVVFTLFRVEGSYHHSCLRQVVREYSASAKHEDRYLQPALKTVYKRKPNSSANSQGRCAIPDSCQLSREKKRYIKDYTSAMSRFDPMLVSGLRSETAWTPPCFSWRPPSSIQERQIYKGLPVELMADLTPGPTCVSILSACESCAMRCMALLSKACCAWRTVAFVFFLVSPWLLPASMTKVFLRARSLFEPNPVGPLTGHRGNEYHPTWDSRRSIEEKPPTATWTARYELKYCSQAYLRQYLWSVLSALTCRPIRRFIMSLKPLAGDGLNHPCGSGRRQTRDVKQDEDL
nr:hypothetical protein CFP56_09303 [Quercus suber]